MTILDPEKQKRAKEYARIRRRLWLVNTVIGAVYVLLWLFMGWAISLREWLGKFTTNEWLLVGLFAVIFGGAYSIINFPLSYYSGFILPHRFDQSNQSLKDWIIDQFKGLAVGVPLSLLLLELLYLALRATGELWWLWAAGGM